MRYLYGDSTPSPLQANFLAFLRDAIEFCVHVLVAQEGLTALRTKRAKVDESAEAERKRIAELRKRVIEAAESSATDGPDSLSLAAVKSVVAAAEQGIAATLADLDAKLAADRAALDAKERSERDSCLEAFGRWMAVHQPYKGTLTVACVLDESGTLQGELTGMAPYGVEWKCAIELQAEHPMLHGGRVGDFVTQIELAIPEPSGWLKKGSKKLQRIDTYAIDAVSCEGSDVVLQLRATPRGPTGLDVAIRNDDIKIVLAGAKDEASAVDLNEDNRQRILALRDRVIEALTTHAGVHRRVVTATLDGAPLADGADLSLVAKRVIEAAAPIVKQILNHSLSPNELVIRRLLGNDRREEIFVTTASLLDKVGRLPRALRPVFAPLGLDLPRARTPVTGSPFEPPPEPAPLPAREPEPTGDSARTTAATDPDAP